MNQHTMLDTLNRSMLKLKTDAPGPCETERALSSSTACTVLRLNESYHDSFDGAYRTGG